MTHNKVSFLREKASLFDSIEQYQSGGRTDSDSF